MTKKQWKQLNRAHRVLIKDVYSDECSTSVRNKYEALPTCAKVFARSFSGYSIPHLWSVFKRVVDSGADRSLAKKTFSRCLKHNTMLGPKAEVTIAYPCYWDGN